jgi:hypothetical protein
MAHIENLNLLDKARRRYRSERAKDSNLPALVSGGGEVKANGKLRIELPLLDGSIVIFIAAPRVEWTLDFGYFETPGKSKEITQSDRAHYALDVLLNVMADAERHVPKPDSAIAN